MQVFMNVATGGFGTEITAQTDEKLKNSLGGAAYILTGDSQFCVRCLTPCSSCPVCLRLLVA